MDVQDMCMSRKWGCIDPVFSQYHYYWEGFTSLSDGAKFKGFPSATSSQQGAVSDGHLPQAIEDETFWGRERRLDHGLFGRDCFDNALISLR